MVTGPTGVVGATVLRLVVEEYRIDPGPAPIPHRHLEESRVPGRGMKRGPAMKHLVQVKMLTLRVTSYILRTLDYVNL